MTRNPLKRLEGSPYSTPLPASPAVLSSIENCGQLEEPTDFSLKDTETTTALDSLHKQDPLGVEASIEAAPRSFQDPVAETNPPRDEYATKMPEKTEMEESEPPRQVEIQDITSDNLPNPVVVQEPIDKEATEAAPAEGITAQPEECPESPIPDTPPISESAPPEKEGDDTVTQRSPQPSVPASTAIDQSAEIEALQARLKQVEQRFTDVSTSFKRLQAEKSAADAILREMSPLESINDSTALRQFFTELKTKDLVFQGEINRLNQKLELQEDRMEKIRDTHEVESHSQSEELKKLKTQLDETEALFQAAQRATSNAEDSIEKCKEENVRLQKDIESSKNTAKEEEEKRVKAISLLKTVRQKLVKAEKEKEDALRDLLSFKEREKDDKSKELAERATFQHELESLTAAHEKTTSNLKAQFGRDIANMRERYEQEIAALRGQFELDLASLKTSHTKELGAKVSQITTLENSLNNVTRDKNVFFDQLQLRQAEVESSQTHLESLQHQNAEFQFQLRESNDRLALLKEECAELVREQESRFRDAVTSPDEVARMVSATEAKYEAKLAEMRRNVSILEKERYDSEADWSRKLKEKVKDLEDLKKVLGSATKTRQDDENIVAGLKEQLMQAEEKTRTLELQASELPRLRAHIQELEKSSLEHDEEIKVKILVLEKQIEETRAREAQIKQSNKTLREELRKVQSSAALLERQRNPGVGYWTTRPEGNGNGAAEPRVSSESPSRVSSPTPSTSTSNKNEEEVNLEYLRNVILQFLEHKEMRPNLVKVLSIILHFTPQETRRLIAKV